MLYILAGAPNYSILKLRETKKSAIKAPNHEINLSIPTLLKDVNTGVHFSLSKLLVLLAIDYLWLPGGATVGLYSGQAVLVFLAIAYYLGGYENGRQKKRPTPIYILA